MYIFLKCENFSVQIIAIQYNETKMTRNQKVAAVRKQYHSVLEHKKAKSKQVIIVTNCTETQFSSQIETDFNFSDMYYS